MAYWQAVITPKIVIPELRALGVMTELAPIGEVVRNILVQDVGEAHERAGGITQECGQKIWDLVAVGFGFEDCQLASAIAAIRRDLQY